MTPREVLALCREKDVKAVDFIEAHDVSIIKSRQAAKRVQDVSKRAAER